MSDPRRTVSLHVRATPEERDELRRLAEAADTDVSSYLLDCALPDRARVDGRSVRWEFEARRVAAGLAPGDRLTPEAILPFLRPALRTVLQSQGLDLREDPDGYEVVRLP